MLQSEYFLMPSQNDNCMHHNAVPQKNPVSGTTIQSVATPILSNSPNSQPNIHNTAEIKPIPHIGTTPTVKQINNTEVPINFETINLGVNGQVRFNIEKFNKLFERNKIKIETVCEKNRNEFDNLKISSDLEACSNENLKGPTTQLGRSKDYEGSKITVKSKRPSEDEHDFKKEGRMQLFLNKKREEWGLKSKIPTPLHCTSDTFYYKRSDGYHSYLTDIQDQEEFEAGLKTCAHDFAVLLQQGIGYLEPVSVFHATRKNCGITTTEGTLLCPSQYPIKQEIRTGRYYTLFPGILGAYTYADFENKRWKGTQDGGFNLFGMCAGKIDFVCSPEHNLYPDCGRDGIRDLGDFVWIDKHQKEVQGLRVCKQFNESAAIGHFISFYHMVFLLIIAKRAQSLELQGKTDKEIWKTTSNSFKNAMTHFLLAFQPESPLLKDGKLSEIADWERFEKQLQFSFTTKDREKDCGWEHSKEEYWYSDHNVSELWATESIPSEATIREIWGPGCTWEKSFSRMRNGNEPSGYTPLGGFIGGHLGNRSAPNPLLDGIKAIYNMVYSVLDNSD